MNNPDNLTAEQRAALSHYLTNLRQSYNFERDEVIRAVIREQIAVGERALGLSEGWMLE